ncbi:hypothetical protein N9W17_00045 [Jannaschia sp.]|nr:hypothetical protein [Jannaschia sp.]
MKTLITSALLALATVVAVSPVSAQQIGVGAAAAIARFNQDFDSQDGRISLGSATYSGVAVSTRSGSLGGVFDRFNADFDSQDNVRGQQGVTILSGAPAFGADIHDRIRRESLENE